MIQLPEALETAVRRELSTHFGDGAIRSIQAVRGGCINHCFRLDTAGGSAFLKVNEARRYPHMFAREADGLLALEQACPGITPAILAVGEAGHHQYLLLAFLEGGHSRDDDWQILGRDLARIHQQTSDRHGFDADNYIGSLPQGNHWTDDARNFYQEQRLLPLLRRCRDEDLMDSSLVRDIESLAASLEDHIPDAPASLVHGDLWSGNVHAGVDGRLSLLDPAVAYQHREADLAMTRLFGPFPAAFYQGYDEVFPLESGWRERQGLFQLYPLLVHVNLFGASYASSVRSILRKYAQ